MNACFFILLPKGEKCGVAMLSRENRWSSKSHHACMFGRVVTEVNAVKIRPMGQIFGQLFQHFVFELIANYLQNWEEMIIFAND